MPVYYALVSHDKNPKWEPADLYQIEADSEHEAAAIAIRRGWEEGRVRDATRPVFAFLTTDTSEMPEIVRRLKIRIQLAGQN